MLIDDVTIHVKSGKGGDGVVRFTRTMMNEGPTGGNGGRGGEVIIRGVSDLGALKRFRMVKAVSAMDGEGGGQNMKTGRDGAPAIIQVPIGTVVHDLTHKKDYDISQRGQEVVIAKGGNGGFGNYYYRSSRNTTPKRANPGLAGEELDLRLELKLIADIGFVGLPNIGKSTLLNELTKASSKVANYKFTTLEPSLGVYYSLILADIPGLIEGAAVGKGLGHKFLRHIERTRVLFHFVAADSADPINDYKTIRKELGTFNKKLLKKNEWIIVSKKDERPEKEVQKILVKLKKLNPNALAISIIDSESIEELKKVLNKIKANSK